MVFNDRSTYEKLSGIYKITHIDTGKTYVGQTKMRFIKRFWHHRWKLRDGSHDNAYLQNAWTKHGSEKFEFEVLKVFDKDSNMNEAEINYIKKLNSFGAGGFNLTVGGEGKKGAPMSEEAKRIVGEKNRIHNLGRVHSAETRARMRRSSPRRKLTPEEIEVLRQSRLGTKHTEEAKRQMSESHTGKGSVLDNEKAAMIKRKLMSGESRVDVAESMGVNYAIVKSVMEEVAWGHVKVEGWDEFFKDFQANKKPRSKTLSDREVRSIRELLESGKTQAEISRKLKINSSVISKVKNRKTYRNVL